MNRHILILLDKTVFRLLFWIVVLAAQFRKDVSRGELISPRPDSHFLVIRPGGLGDAIMTIPTLRALRESYPQSRISVICVGKNRAGFELLPFQDELIQIDSTEAMGRLIGRRFDIVFDLEPFRRISSIVAWLSGAKVRVGFDTGSRRRLYTHLVNYAHDHLPESANLTRQLKVIGVRVPEHEYTDLSVEICQDDEEEASRILKDNGVTGPLIVVAPSVLKPQHRWSNEKWALVTSRLLQAEDDLRVILMGRPGDREDAGEVVRRLPDKDRVLNLVGRTSLPVSLAILKRSRALLACDGGILYMAAAVKCPSLSLWGPGVMERFKPPGEIHVGIRKEHPCIPCVTWDRLGEFPQCPYNRKCYSDISVRDIESAYGSLACDIVSRARGSSHRTSGAPDTISG
jgi:ADP-heptose:LPS heptosyltransferase